MSTNYKFVDQEIAKYYELPYKVMNERPLMHGADANIPDRVVTNANYCVVIDYNTGIRRNEDIAQLNAYMEELKKFEFEEVRGYLLYTIDKSVVEVLS